MTRARDLADSADLAFDGDTLKIDSTNDRVGVNEVSPDTMLHLKDTTANDGPVIRLEGSGQNAANQLIGGVEWKNTDTSGDGPNVTGAVRHYSANSTGSGGYTAFHTHDGSEGGEDSDAVERMRIDASGNLIVGNTTPDSATSTTIYSGGQIRANTSGTNAIILDRRDSDGSILEIKKDDSSVGTIGSRSGNLYLGSGDTTLKFEAGGDYIVPANTTGADRDNAIDLGNTATQFKDLYLSGGLYVGGTGSANYLDDFEEGTFTPVLDTTGTDFTSVTYSHQNGFYVKIGKRVFISGRLRTSAIDKTGSTGYPRISGLPFTAKGTHYTGIINVGYSSGWSSVAPSGLLIDPGQSYMSLFGYANSDARSSISGQLGINNLTTTGNDVMFGGSYDIA